MASTAGIGLKCEYCDNTQRSEKAADVGMCDEHYMASLWYCEECKSPEKSICRHKSA